MNTPPPVVVLHALDYAVMALYLGGLLAMGWYYRSFANASLENYFLGGRRFSGWLNGTSYASTCMNADVAPAYCGMTVVTGLFVCWWYISRFGLALMIGGLLFAVAWRRLKLFTSPEFYELRFHGDPAITMRTWVALRSAFIAVVAWTGAGLLGLSKVSEGLLGWSRWETFAWVIPVILFYVLTSGYVGVVMSDLFQALIMVGGSLVLMGMVWADFGGPVGLYQSLVDQFGTEIVSWHPPASHEMLGFLGILAWTIGTAVGYGGDVAPMSGAMEGQRLLSCKNHREASKMYLWTQLVLFLMLVVLTLPALGAVLTWPGLRTGEINKELAYGMLLGHYLPTGLLGLLLVALFASIMSTVDSNMNFGAQVFVNDVYRRSIRPNASMEHYLAIGKWVAFAIMGLALVVATRAENVIDIAVFMLGFSSAELTANWGQWWWWRFNGPARLAASFGGPAIFLLYKFVIFEHVVHAGADAAYLTVLSSILTTGILWVVVALVTKPEPEERLLEFYRRARPAGWWGPIALKAGGPATDSRSIVSGFGLAFLGAGAIAAGVIGFSCLYVARWMPAGIALAIATAAGLVFRVRYTAYLARACDGDAEPEHA